MKSKSCYEYLVLLRRPTSKRRMMPWPMPYSRRKKLVRPSEIMCEHSGSDLSRVLRVTMKDHHRAIEEKLPGAKSKELYLSIGVFWDCDRFAYASLNLSRRDLAILKDFDCPVYFSVYPCSDKAACDSKVPPKGKRAKAKSGSRSRSGTKEQHER